MKAILAADQNFGIGKDGKLLAYISDDLKFFKSQTINKTVILGRKTLDTFPKQRPLANRNNIILTRNNDLKIDGAIVAHSKEEVMELIKDIPSEEVYVIGGAEIYKLFYENYDEIILTRIQNVFDADRYFYDLDKSNDFEKVEESDLYECNGLKFTFNRYKRSNTYEG